MTARTIPRCWSRRFTWTLPSFDRPLGKQGRVRVEDDKVVAAEDEAGVEALTPRRMNAMIRMMIVRNVTTAIEKMAWQLVSSSWTRLLS